jgi:hypothetical protein
MGQIPQDATHWDSSDWIEWHRSASGLDDRPCIAATQDPLARLTALQVSLLRSAKAYFQMTGHHLPLYRTIAEVHAAIHFNIPLQGPDEDNSETGVELLCLPPDCSANAVEVDLNKAFQHLIVVRISDSFKVEARFVDRAKLPHNAKGLFDLDWKSLPRGR